MSFNEDVVSRINIYPIKSLRAATVEDEPPQWLDVCQTGFEAHGVADREFTIVEADAAMAGLFVSQRGWNDRRQTVHSRDARLAAVAVDIRSDHLRVSSKRVGSIELGTLGYKDVDEAEAYATIHGNKIAAYDQGEEAAAYFGKLLGREVRLLRSDRRQPRSLPEQQRRPGASNQVLAADGVPFLLTSQASMRWLINNQIIRPKEEAILESQVEIDRYRANIVVAGESLGPFREDHAEELQIGDMAAFVVGACSRCPVPNINQDTGQADNVSSRLLRSRAGRRVYVETDKGIFFGQNLNHVYKSNQQIAIGDAVTVMSETVRPNIILSTNSA